MPAEQKKKKLIGIVARNAVFLSDNIEGGYSYSSNSLQNYFFDGKEPEKTYDKDWVKVDSIPKIITKKEPEQRINKRYEIREGFQVTELTPKEIAYEDMDEYSDVFGLYTLKYDLEEAKFVEVPFEINVIEEIDGDFEIKRSDYNLQHTFLDKLTTHPILLKNKPCSLTAQQTFKIIREHIKRNINLKYATVKSDYDFCLTVEKVLETEPVEYQVNINAAYPRRKPKYETRYRTKRTATVYKAAPKEYQSYPVVKPFKGDNADDLKKNVDEFLENLMKKINEPVVDCAHCNGRGVVIDGN